MKKRMYKGTYEPRIRFNWGYHDGASDLKNGWTRLDGATVSNIEYKHFDKSYSRGYVEGYYDFKEGIYNENSTAAWMKVTK